MSRILFTLLALWSLVLVPSLCLAGTLEHLCTVCPEELGCGHEDGCIDDPCAAVVVVTDLRVVDWEPTPVLVVIPVVPWEADLADFPVLETLTSPSPPMVLYKKQLPCPESSLPLLI